MNTLQPSVDTSLSPEALEDLVVHGSAKQVVLALKPLDAKSRKKLSQTASKLYREITRRDVSQTLTISWKKITRQVSGTLDVNTQLAVLGLCPLSVTKRVNMWYMGNGDNQDLLLQVLQDRRPDWMDAWLEHRIEQEFPAITWLTIQKLIASGTCRKPAGEGYIRLMASHFFLWKDNSKTPKPHSISSMLIANTDTLEDVYRLFEVETWAFNTTYYDENPPYPDGFESWPMAIERLIETGHLDRQKMLDALLGGMTRDFTMPQLAGFKRMHARLSPTLDEIKEREATYRTLLGLRVNATTTFALSILAELIKAQRLDAASFFAASGVVFELTTKGSAQRVIKLAKKIVKKNPESVPEAIGCILHAFGHPSADVQEAAIVFLELFKDEVDEDAKQAILNSSSFLSPALQARALALAGTEPADAFAAEESLSQDQFDAMHDRISVLPSGIRERLGLSGDDIFSAFPPPLTHHITDSRVLHTVSEIQPIQDLQELIDTISHAIEIIDSPDEVERILDGLSRLCHKRPHNFALLTGPLLNRVKEPQYSESIRGLISGYGGVSLALRDLLLTWLTGQYHESARPKYFRYIAPILFYLQRIQELKKRVYKKQFGPLLSAPTHSKGWIDPTAFVVRLKHMDAAWTHTHREDLTQALLRLAPDRRQEALAQISEQGDIVSRVVRWALGSPDRPTDKDKHEYELWITAGRARSPLMSLREAYASLTISDDQPDGLEPATYHWTSTVRESRGWDRKVYRHPAITLRISGMEPIADEDEAEIQRTPVHEVASFLYSSFQRILTKQTQPLWKRIPTAAMHRISPKLGWHTDDLCGAWIIHWLHFLWPQHTDSSVTMGIYRMIERIDDNTATTVPNYAFLEPCFDIQRPWTEMMMLSLWTALVSKDSDLQNGAIDAMIEGIDDGRGHPTPLSDVLIQLAQGGWIKTNRLAESLRQIAITSDIHAYVVSSILDRLIADIRELPRNLHQLLQLLLDLHVTLGMSVPEPTALRLRTITGKGKAAKTARGLCALSGVDVPVSVVLIAIEQRLDRAESWLS